MDNINLLIFLTGINTAFFLTFYTKISNRFNTHRVVNEILHTKLLQLEKRVDKIEDLNLKILEKNIIFGQNREWDNLSSDYEEDHLEGLD